MAVKRSLTRESKAAAWEKLRSQIIDEMADRGLHGGAMARKLGMRRQSWHNFMSQESDVKLSSLEKVADAFGMEVRFVPKR